MMGFPCLRTQGDFFASLDRRSGDLVLKLPAERVTELVDQGAARAFAPSGRVFKEWAAFTEPDEATWRSVPGGCLPIRVGVDLAQDHDGVQQDFWVVSPGCLESMHTLKQRQTGAIGAD